ncbi:MAG: serine/threonine protein kinase, partial [Myxococcota bacterium]
MSNQPPSDDSKRPTKSGQETVGYDQSPLGPASEAENPAATTRAMPPSPLSRHHVGKAPPRGRLPKATMAFSASDVSSLARRAKDRVAETVLDVPPIAAAPTPQPGKTTGSEAPRSAVRAYEDGVYTTVSREVVSEQELKDAQAVQLPYKSTEVIRRIGGYDILGELGRGGMGVVYDAYSLRLCRRCAIKVMIAGEQASQIQLVRFQNEAMLAARLRHPNIVQVFDAGEEEGQFYFVMEYVDGLSLEDIAEQPSFETKELVRVAAKVGYALAEAHKHGVVHRDVKPENVLVDLNGEPHITDFGIAANVRPEQRITNDGALMGTPAYMSPEQINGEVARIGPASDQYSLAASLFHMVTGRTPFVADSTIDLLIAGLNDEAPLASTVAKKNSKRSIDLDLDTILAKGLEKKAAQRYPSIEAFSDDLMAYVEDRPIAARPVSSAERLRKLIRRNRAAFAISA